MTKPRIDSPTTTPSVWDFRSWRVLRGCSPVSRGCNHCVAEANAAKYGQLRGAPMLGRVLQARDGADRPRWSGEVVLDLGELRLALGWRQPRQVHVAPGSDLFQPAVTDAQIAAVFGVMAATPQHTFLITTKHAERMQRWFASLAEVRDQSVALSTCARATQALLDENAAARFAIDPGATWPLPNVWIGISAEDQATADDRISQLLRTPAVLRFAICEPLLGPIDTSGWLHRCTSCVCSSCPPHHDAIDLSTKSTRCHLTCDRGSHLDWIVVGCEVGMDRRPCDVTWLRALRDQCTETKTPLWLRAAPYLSEICTTCNRKIHVEVNEFSTYLANQTCRCGHTRRVANGALPGVGARRRPDDTIEAPYLDGVQHLALPRVE